MKLKNIALTAAQVGVSASAGIVLVPSIVVVATVSTIGLVARAIEIVGGNAIAEVYFGSYKLCDTLESWKDASTNVEVVKEGFGDNAKVVN